MTNKNNHLLTNKNTFQYYLHNINKASLTHDRQFDTFVNIFKTVKLL